MPTEDRNRAGHAGEHAMGHTIRRATSADAGTLADLGQRTFIATFGHLYRPEDLQAFLDESHTEAAYARVLADPAYALWIADAAADAEQARERRAIGYAQAGPCGLPHPEVRAQDGELKSLYVLAVAQNSGIGVKPF